jgi:hypothetical protein
MAKPIRQEKISDKLWIDVEPLQIADLYLREDSDNYEAAVKQSLRKDFKLFRVVTRFSLPSGQAEDGSSALFTSRTEAIATAKRWATDERAAEV